MDTVITRILEIEKQSALSLEKAVEASKKKIEAHRLTLEEQKTRAKAEILSAENTRLTEALKALAQKTESEASTFGREYEARLQNPALLHKVKEKITDLLLSG